MALVLVESDSAEFLVQISSLNREAWEHQQTSEFIIIGLIGFYNGLYGLIAAN